MHESITLRPATTEDREFLFAVYASTRAEELAQVNWTDEQKMAFLRQQFIAQDSHYTTHYPTAQFQVIQRAEQRIGRLYLDEWPHETRIVDIALLPHYRGQGIGSSLLHIILANAQRRQVPVSIHVESFNRALHLYHRLGFQLVEDKGLYLFLEKRPEVAE